MSLNINRSITDAFYRYKMPPIVAKVEGKGNGIKTVIVNMADVARSLSRPAGYTTKFFGCELGSQTTIDDKIERYIVNGEHTAARFQDLLDLFIQKYVLCANCGNPETNMYVTKSEKLESKCLACGHVFMINMIHKLTSYILKNPPNDINKSGVKGKSKEERRKAKQAKGSKEEHNSGEDEESEQKDTSSAKDSKSDIKEPKVPTMRIKVDEDDWSADTSEEAVKQRMELLTGAIVGLATNDDLELASEDRLQKFFDFVQARASQNKFPAKEVVVEAERLDVKDKGVMVLVEILLDVENTDDLIAAALRHQGLLQRFVIDNAKAQKYLLGALERMAFKHSKHVEKFGHLLKALYDNDILEEEAVLEWGAKVSKKYVSKEFATKLHDKAQPFLTWLQEAEEESEEEEEEEVSFEAASKESEQGSSPAKEAKSAKEEAPAPTTSANDADDDDDDLDIDAI